MNWRFDIDLTFSISRNAHFLQYWLSKSRANCDFSAFSLIIELIIEKSSNWLHQVIFIRFRFFSSCLIRHFRLQLWFDQSFNYESSKSSKKTVWKIVWRRIFTNCMLVSLRILWNWIYDKRYMLKAHETYKFVCKECIFEILVVETSIWKKKK